MFTDTGGTTTSVGGGDQAVPRDQQGGPTDTGVALLTD